jgi:hypothetical protein
MLRACIVFLIIVGLCDGQGYRAGSLIWKSSETNANRTVDFIFAATVGTMTVAGMHIAQQQFQKRILHGNVPDSFIFWVKKCMRFGVVVHLMLFNAWQLQLSYGGFIGSGIGNRPVVGDVVELKGWVPILVASTSFDMPLKSVNLLCGGQVGAHLIPGRPARFSANSNRSPCYCHQYRRRHFPGKSTRGFSNMTKITRILPTNTNFQGVWTVSIPYPASTPAFYASITGCCRPAASPVDPFSTLAPTSSGTLLLGAGSRFSLLAYVTPSATSWSEPSTMESFSSGSLDTVPLLHVYAATSPDTNEASASLRVNHPGLRHNTNCSSPNALACAAALRCENGQPVHVPLANGTHCGSYMSNCLKLLCLARNHEMSAVAASSAVAGMFHCTSENATCAPNWSVNNQTNHAVTTLFVRQSVGEAGDGGLPSSSMCRHAYVYGGDAACARAKGCCSVDSGCEACVVISSSGKLYVRHGTQKVCVCVCVCVCACVCLFESKGLCLCQCMYVCMYVSVYVCV